MLMVNQFSQTTEERDAQTSARNANKNGTIMTTCHSHQEQHTPARNGAQITNQSVGNQLRHVKHLTTTFLSAR